MGKLILTSIILLCFSETSLALNIQKIRREIADFRQKLKELRVDKIFTEGLGDGVESRDFDTYMKQIKKGTYRNHFAYKISDLALQWGRNLRKHYRYELKGAPIIDHIVIDVGTTQAYWLHDDKLIDSVQVAVGDESAGKRTRIGIYTIGEKVRYPVSHWTYVTIPYGHPYNSFGARKLKLYKNNKYTYYAMHGTNDETCIGKHISMGCIRFHNSDILILYELVTKKTTVEIIKKPHIAYKVESRIASKNETQIKVVSDSAIMERIPSNNLSELYKVWIEKTIDYSRSAGCPVLIIYKLEHQIALYDRGEFIRAYKVELGYNPIDDKLRRGDGCTPEGMYYVVRKLDIGQTSYHRAFLINYPDDYDKAEFYEAKRSGKIPLQASIGGAIEIHGHGGQGMDWTLGCVALKDEDIDELFPLIEAGSEWGSGTPVTIVKYNPIAR